MIQYKKTALLLGLLGTLQADAASSKVKKIGAGIASVILLGKVGIDWIQVTHMLENPDKKSALQLLNASPNTTLSFRIGSFYDPAMLGDRIYRDQTAQRAHATVYSETYINQDIEEVTELTFGRLGILFPESKREEFESPMHSLGLMCG